MSEYQHLTKEETDVVKNFPELSQEDLDQANDLFQHYIFYRTEKNGDRIIDTSCCHKHEARYEGFRMLSDSNHHNFMCSSHNDSVECPYCGKAATLKNIGKSGKRRSLSDQHHVVFVNAEGDSLFAQAYWVRKDYEHRLDGDAGYSLDTLYQFQLGKARMFSRSYSNWYCQTEQARISRMKICEPFQRGCMMSGHESYFVIGMDKLKESSLRYCQYSRWGTYHYSSKHSDFIKYMTLYCVYPKQVEMLMKAGAQKFVEEFLYYRRKNAYVFCWEQENPVKAFGLTKAEIKEFLSGSKVPNVLHLVKKLRKHGIRQSITEMEKLYRQLDFGVVGTLVQRCLLAGLRPQKVITYLDQYTGGCHAGGYRSIHDILRHWSDYMDAAKAIGYDVTQERVAMPRDLQESHDIATAEHRRRLKAEKDRQEAERDATLRAELELKQMTYKQRREKLQKKYSMISNGLFIRVPKDGEEIIAEGQALQHCVAGYAERHMNGTLTILFLRRVDDPEKPLCTIEMDGKGLVQIHGFKNERENGKRIAQNPLEVYGFFMGPWLRWVQEGSKRDKNKNPMIPAAEVKKEVQTA